MALPTWIRASLEATWSRQLAEALEKLDGVSDPARYTAAVDLVDQARHLGLTLELAPASLWFGRLLVHRLEAIAAGSDARAWQEYLELLHIAARLSLSLPERSLQDRLFQVLRERMPALLQGLRDARDPAYELVSAILAVSSRLNLRTEEARERLRPLEEGFATDPNYWP